jgi:hypothetical protein
MSDLRLSTLCCFCAAGAFIQGSSVLSWAGNNTAKLGLVHPAPYDNMQCWTLISTNSYGQANKVGALLLCCCHNVTFRHHYFLSSSSSSSSSTHHNSFKQATCSRRLLLPLLLLLLLSPLLSVLLLLLLPGASEEGACIMLCALAASCSVLAGIRNLNKPLLHPDHVLMVLLLPPPGAPGEGAC